MRSAAVINADVAATHRYLRRLFPKRGVRVEPRDYGHLVHVGFVIEDDIGATRCAGIETTAAHATTGKGRYQLGGKLLRAAYPRGWAVP